MFKNLLQVYALFVCLVASFILMVMGGQILSHGIDCVFTEYRYISDMDRFGDNQRFLAHKKRKNPKGWSHWSRQSSEYVDKKRKEEKQNYVWGKQKKAIERVFDQLGWLLSALLFFSIHWVIYRRSLKRGS